MFSAARGNYRTIQHIVHMFQRIHLLVSPTTPTQLLHAEMMCWRFCFPFSSRAICTDLLYKYIHMYRRCLVHFLPGRRAPLSSVCLSCRHYPLLTSFPFVPLRRKVIIAHPFPRVMATLTIYATTESRTAAAVYSSSLIPLAVSLSLRYTSYVAPHDIVDDDNNVGDQ